jgi:hypothetical protein
MMMHNDDDAQRWTTTKTCVDYLFGQFTKQLILDEDIDDYLPILLATDSQLNAASRFSGRCRTW